ncbi:MAG: macrolide 2'-phosphotransferase [Bacteriovoracaceae bacterium]
MNEYILELAARHNLPVQKIISTNELGLDFQTAIAEEEGGKRWILRIPRRCDLLSKIQKEKECLQFLKSKVSFDVPDWKISSQDLVAYPLLTDKPALEVNTTTQESTWNIDISSFDYSENFAYVLFELHSVATQGSSLKVQSSKEVRQEIIDEIDLVKSELELSNGLEVQWRAWVDDESYWPTFSVLNHGDLYAGHILVNSKGLITGIIDWSEMQVGDPSLDFVGHYVGLGEQHLDRTLEKYKRIGGKTWPRMKDHIIRRAAISSLKFAVFALTTGNDEYIQTAKGQLKG